MVIDTFISQQINTTKGVVVVKARWIGLYTTDPDLLIQLITTPYYQDFSEEDKGQILDTYNLLVKNTQEMTEKIESYCKSIVNGGVISDEIGKFVSFMMLLVDENGLLKTTWNEVWNLSLFEVLVIQNIQKYSIQKVNEQIKKQGARIPSYRKVL